MAKSWCDQSTWQLSKLVAFINTPECQCHTTQLKAFHLRLYQLIKRLVVSLTSSERLQFSLDFLLESHSQLSVIRYKINLETAIRNTRYVDHIAIADVRTMP